MQIYFNSVCNNVHTVSRDAYLCQPGWLAVMEMYLWLGLVAFILLYPFIRNRVQGIGLAKRLSKTLLESYAAHLAGKVVLTSLSLTISLASVLRGLCAHRRSAGTGFGQRYATSARQLLHAMLHTNGSGDNQLKVLWSLDNAVDISSSEDLTAPNPDNDVPVIEQHDFGTEELHRPISKDWRIGKSDRDIIKRKWNAWLNQYLHKLNSGIKQAREYGIFTPRMVMSSKSHAVRMEEPTICVARMEIEVPVKNTTPQEEHRPHNAETQGNIQSVTQSRKDTSGVQPTKATDNNNTSQNSTNSKFAKMPPKEAEPQSIKDSEGQTRKCPVKQPVRATVPSKQNIPQCTNQSETKEQPEHKRVTAVPQIIKRTGAQVQEPPAAEGCKVGEVKQDNNTSLPLNITAPVKTDHVEHDPKNVAKPKPITNNQKEPITNTQRGVENITLSQRGGNPQGDLNSKAVPTPVKKKLNDVAVKKDDPQKLQNNTPTNTVTTPHDAKSPTGSMSARKKPIESSPSKLLETMFIHANEESVHVESENKESPKSTKGTPNSTISPVPRQNVTHSDNEGNLQDDSKDMECKKSAENHTKTSVPPQRLENAPTAHIQEVSTENFRTTLRPRSAGNKPNETKPPQRLRAVNTTVHHDDSQNGACPKVFVKKPNDTIPTQRLQIDTTSHNDEVRNESSKPMTPQKQIEKNKNETTPSSQPTENVKCVRHEDTVNDATRKIVRQSLGGEKTPKNIPAQSNVNYATLHGEEPENHDSNSTKTPVPRGRKTMGTASPQAVENVATARQENSNEQPNYSEHPKSTKKQVIPSPLRADKVTRPQVSNIPKGGAMNTSRPKLVAAKLSDTEAKPTVKPVTRHAVKNTLPSVDVAPPNPNTAKQGTSSATGQRVLNDTGSDSATAASTSVRRNAVRQNKPLAAAKAKPSFPNASVQSMTDNKPSEQLMGRIKLLESRLRLEEIRNRTWSTRMAQTEAMLQTFREQLCVMDHTVRELRGDRTKHHIQPAVKSPTFSKDIGSLIRQLREEMEFSIQKAEKDRGETHNRTPERDTATHCYNVPDNMCNWVRESGDLKCLGGHRLLEAVASRTLATVDSSSSESTEDNMCRVSTPTSSVTHFVQRSYGNNVAEENGHRISLKIDSSTKYFCEQNDATEATGVYRTLHASDSSTKHFRRDNNNATKYAGVEEDSEIEACDWLRKHFMINKNIVRSTCTNDDVYGSLNGKDSSTKFLIINTDITKNAGTEDGVYHSLKGGDYSRTPCRSNRTENVRLQDSNMCIRLNKGDPYSKHIIVDRNTAENIRKDDRMNRQLHKDEHLAKCHRLQNNITESIKYDNRKNGTSKNNGHPMIIYRMENITNRHVFNEESVQKQLNAGDILTRNPRMRSDLTDYNLIEEGVYKQMHKCDPSSKSMESNTHEHINYGDHRYRTLKPGNTSTNFRNKHGTGHNETDCNRIISLLTGDNDGVQYKLATGPRNEKERRARTSFTRCSLQRNTEENSGAEDSVYSSIAQANHSKKRHRIEREQPDITSMKYDDDRKLNDHLQFLRIHKHILNDTSDDDVESEIVSGASSTQLSSDNNTYEVRRREDHVYKTIRKRHPPINPKIEHHANVINKTDRAQRSVKGNEPSVKHVKMANVVTRSSEQRTMKDSKPITKCHRTDDTENCIEEYNSTRLKFCSLTKDKRAMDSFRNGVVMDETFLNADGNKKQVTKDEIEKQRVRTDEFMDGISNYSGHYDTRDFWKTAIKEVREEHVMNNLGKHRNDAELTMADENEKTLRGKATEVKIITTSQAESKRVEERYRNVGLMYEHTGRSYFDSFRNESETPKSNGTAEPQREEKEGNTFDSRFNRDDAIYSGEGSTKAEGTDSEFLRMHGCLEEVRDRLSREGFVMVKASSSSTIRRLHSGPIKVQNLDVSPPNYVLTFFEDEYCIHRSF